MTNYATKMLDWGDPNIGFQQQRGQHGEGVNVTHNIIRFLPLPDGALEINFGTTVHFCGGSVVHRSDGELVLSVEQRRDLWRTLAGPEAEGVATEYIPTWQQLGPEELGRIRDQILDTSKNSLFRSGVKIAAAEIASAGGDKWTLPDLANRRFTVFEGHGVDGLRPEIADRATWSADFRKGVDEIDRGAVFEAEQLRQILDTRPGPDADLATFQNWSRVAGKLLEELK